MSKFARTAEYSSAFADAYVQHAPGIIQWLVSQTHDVELSRDVLQQAFTNSYGSLDTCRSVKEQRSFLYTAARNALVNHLRRAHGEPSLEARHANGIEPVSDEPGYAAIENRDAAEDALGAMSERQQAAVVLRVIRGATFEETGNAF